MTRANSASVLNSPEVSIRSARVLTNMPIRPSISARVRLATGEPMTTSACPDKRLNRLAHAPSMSMYIVTP
ncbi:hypothetical protein D3C78_1808410 [compost metagenome]